MQRVLIAIVVVVAACAAPKTDPRYAQGSGTEPGDTDMVCHEVTDTGTMFSHQECVPRQTIEEQRNDARNLMDRPNAQGAGHSGPGDKH